MVSPSGGVWILLYCTTKKGKNQDLSGIGYIFGIYDKRKSSVSVGMTHGGGAIGFW
jgi:hypothetical protein